MRPHLRLWALPLACLLFALGACNKGGPLPDAATPAPQVKSDGPPVTEQEAKEFAGKITKAVEARDAARIDVLLHVSDLVDRIVSDMNLSDADLRSFRAGAENSLKQNGMGTQIVRGLADGGSYRFLRIHTVDGRPRAQFRMLAGDGSLNYHDYSLARFPDGSVGAEDVYVFVTGEPISQTMRRIIVPIFAQIRGRGSNDATFKDFTKLSELSQAVQQEKPDQAIAIYRQLPQSLQENKAVLLIYAQALMQKGAQGDKDYLAALEKFRTLFPDDPAGDFVSLDYYMLNKQYDKALAALERVDKALGGDAYMDALRGNVLMETGRLDEARKAMEKAIEKEPDLEQPYWMRLSLSLRENKYDDTLAWLKKRAQAVKAPIQNLSPNAEYAEFVKSPQYREWQKWYAAQTKAPAKK